mmetsp:Transcript_21549/g.55953  ORF Transcript_21549/g.55953 Transcript_21549/m.55953 type:complete len:225 (-) Transcript_21549:485-1159(-)
MATISAGVDKKTEDGFGYGVQVNYLGHYMLTEALIPLMEKSERAVIVNLSSVAHRFYSTPVSVKTFFENNGDSYLSSKFAMMVYAFRLQSRLANTSIRSYAVNPGAVRSDIWRFLGKYTKPIMNAFMKMTFLSVFQGSSTSFAAILRGLDSTTAENDAGKHIYISPYRYYGGIVKMFDVLGPYGGAVLMPPAPRAQQAEQCDTFELLTKALFEKEKIDIPLLNQ